MTLTFRKPSQRNVLLWMLILFPFLFGTLNSLLGAPWAVRYLADIAWGMLLLLMLRYHRSLNLQPVQYLLIWVLLFLSFTALVYPAQYQSALYYLWGFRNQFRFYVAFFAFATMLTQNSAEHFLKRMDQLFWLNASVTLIQFLMGLKGDLLGGIFGAEKGVNSYTNLFLLIILTKSILCYLGKQENLGLCIAKYAVASAIAAMAELKFFFFEIGFVLLLAFLLTGFTRRKLALILVSALAFTAGIWLMCRLFPSLQGWFSLKNMLESALDNAGYTSSGDLNRLGGIRVINETWLTRWPQRIFGLGLGNCDTAAFPLVSTPFYQANAASHYTWMSYTMVYLETGYVGLVFYFGFFLGCFASAAKAARRPGANPLFCRMAQIMALCCVLIGIYNSSLRGESGYMAYFILALPYAAGGKYDTLTDH